MIKREYRHGLNKYKWTKEYLKMVFTLWAAIFGGLFVLACFFSVGKDGYEYMNMYAKVFLMLGGPAYVVAAPFVSAEANMKYPKSKCWGDAKNSDAGLFVPICIWGVALLLCAYIHDIWAYILFMAIAAIANDRFLESAANKYDLVEYMEAVSIATGEQLVMQKDCPDNMVKKQLDYEVKRRKADNPNFEPVYLQDLEGIAYREAKEKLRTK